MADKTNPDHPAFTWGEDFPGLSKREHLAAIALQGLLANPNFADELNEVLCTSAVDAADQLIKALNK